MSEKPVPVGESSRITSIDTLRGVAVLGILVMNISAFSMPAAAYMNPTLYGNLSGINHLVWGFNHLFVDMKFLAVFSMLFGAGIILMAERCEARDQKPAWLHYRRMFWLIIFGLLHAHLLWFGDILYSYGMAGLIVYLFRKRTPKWLIIWGLLSISMASGLMFATGAFMDQMPPETQAEMEKTINPSAEVIAREVAAYRGSWLEQMSARVPKAIEMQTGSFLFWVFWRVAGLMLIGMALFKLGMFRAEWSKRTYVKFIVLALGVGFPLIIYGMYYNFMTHWESPGFLFFGLQFNFWASILVSLGWVSVVMLIAKSESLAGIAKRFGAVGRMAFTNYILQTVICTSIFYGHGLGWFGSVERAGQFAIVILVWILQLILSPIWLNKFKYGPLEWLWRSLSYWKLQPFRRPA